MTRTASWLITQIEEAHRQIENGPAWLRLAAEVDYSARRRTAPPDDTKENAR